MNIAKKISHNLISNILGKKFTMENHDYATRPEPRGGETWWPGKIYGVSSNLVPSL